MRSSHADHLKGRWQVEKPPETVVFMVRSFTVGGFTTNSRERDYVIYMHIDVNLDGRGWVCCCSIINSQNRNWWRSCLKSRPHI